MADLLTATTYWIGTLPADALTAASAFHTDHLAPISEIAAQHPVLTIVFPSAEYDHSPWRSAAIADLARANTPRRVNAVAGDNEAALNTAIAWLSQAPGITGQIVAVGGENRTAALG